MTAISGLIAKISLVLSLSAGFIRVPTLADISSVIGQVPLSLSLAHRESTPPKGF